MAAIRIYWSENVGPWAHYAYALTSLAGLLVPRTALWTRRWLRTHVHDRVLAARDLSASPVNS